MKSSYLTILTFSLIAFFANSSFAATTNSSTPVTMQENSSVLFNAMFSSFQLSARAFNASLKAYSANPNNTALHQSLMNQYGNLSFFMNTLSEAFRVDPSLASSNRSFFDAIKTIRNNMIELSKTSNAVKTLSQQLGSVATTGTPFSYGVTALNSSLDAFSAMGKKASRQSQLDLLNAISAQYKSLSNINSAFNGHNVFLKSSLAEMQNKLRDVVRTASSSGLISRAQARADFGNVFSDKSEQTKAETVAITSVSEANKTIQNNQSVMQDREWSPPAMESGPETTLPQN